MKSSSFQLGRTFSLLALAYCFFHSFTLYSQSIDSVGIKESQVNFARFYDELYVLMVESSMDSVGGVDLIFLNATEHPISKRSYKNFSCPLNDTVDIIAQFEGKDSDFTLSPVGAYNFKRNELSKFRETLIQEVVPRRVFVVSCDLSGIELKTFIAKKKE